MLGIDWDVLLGPNEVLAFAALVTAIAGLVAALKAHNNAAKAATKAKMVQANAAQSLSDVSTKVDKNSQLVPILLRRVESLEANFHEVMKVLTNGGAYQPTGHAPTGSSEAAPPPGPPA